MMTNSKKRSDLKSELKVKTDELVSQDEELFANLSKDMIRERKINRADKFRKDNAELLGKVREGSNDLEKNTTNDAHHQATDNLQLKSQGRADELKDNLNYSSLATMLLDDKLIDKDLDTILDEITPKLSKKDLSSIKTVLDWSNNKYWSGGKSTLISDLYDIITYQHLGQTPYTKYFINKN